eukprot:TRINITY_DN11549_c0_g1_i1.p1 TRINITY_DN11549_c0_g1~~TRINITY_DN11549_c0_g1_i1.p1  ORF type:complete len:396 (-),score=91.93 TRINITY_DN11549_c0_g1_i1:134-1321(-)
MEWRRRAMLTPVELLTFMFAAVPFQTLGFGVPAPQPTSMRRGFLQSSTASVAESPASSMPWHPHLSRIQLPDGTWVLERKRRRTQAILPPSETSVAADAQEPMSFLQFPAVVPAGSHVGGAGCECAEIPPATQQLTNGAFAETLQPGLAQNSLPLSSNAALLPQPPRQVVQAAMSPAVSSDQEQEQLRLEQSSLQQQKAQLIRELQLTETQIQQVETAEQMEAQRTVAVGPQQASQLALDRTQLLQQLSSQQAPPPPLLSQQQAPQPLLLSQQQQQPQQQQQQQQELQQPQQQQQQHQPQGQQLYDLTSLVGPAPQPLWQQVPGPAFMPPSQMLLPPLVQLSQQTQPMQQFGIGGNGMSFTGVGSQRLGISYGQMLPLSPSAFAPWLQAPLAPMH